MVFVTQLLFVSSGTPKIIGGKIGFITDFISLRQGTHWQNNPYFTYLEGKKSINYQTIKCIFEQCKTFFTSPLS